MFNFGIFLKFSSSPLFYFFTTPLNLALQSHLCNSATPIFLTLPFYNPFLFLQHLALRRTLHVRCFRDDAVPLTCLKIIPNVSVCFPRNPAKSSAKSLAQIPHKRLKFRSIFTMRIVTLFREKTRRNRPKAVPNAVTISMLCRHFHNCRHYRQPALSKHFQDVE